MKVLAAMSGGVDSAVAAARAVDAGHDVTGVHFALSADPAQSRTGARGCCTLSDARDARRAADRLEIPFYVWDVAERFREDVIDDFVAEYAAGRTPNPCVRCNERIKFAAVLDRAQALGFDAVCTGHYARLQHDPHGRPVLSRSVDLDKDQSYVLAVLSIEQLQATLLPLGESTKTQVRAEAAERGLAVAQKPDSHDICFIPDGDTRTWLGARLGVRAGPIVDAESGEQLGWHEGTHGFTIGQRKGLGLTAPAPDGRPRYVVSIDTETNTVRVGAADMLDATLIETGPATWVSGAPSHALTEHIFVQIRAHGVAVPAMVYERDTGLRAELEQPLRAVAAGQTMVVYRDDQVLCSATIERSAVPRLEQFAGRT